MGSLFWFQTQCKTTLPSLLKYNEQALEKAISPAEITAVQFL